MNPINSVLIGPSRAFSKFGGLLVVVGCLSHSFQGHSAQQASSTTTNATDKADCQRQLNIIYGAIQQYRKQHGGKLPDKLSDLTPDFLHDPNDLTCPFVLKRGGLRSWKKQFQELSPDPHTSYSYEFPPVPLHYNLWRGLPKKTWGEFKQRAMEVLGPVVPIVRCHDHRPRLNLAYNGPIYESELYWEENFTKDHYLLALAKLYPSPARSRQLDPAEYPPRDARADTRLLDLTRFYNAALTNSWQGFEGNHLAGLPAGLQEFDGVRFDVRGVIQLRGTELPTVFPEKVEGIKVHQSCRRIHFLHAASFRYQSGTTNGCYTIHYSDGRVEEIPLLYGKQAADWWFDPEKPAGPTDARVVWTGENEAAKAYGKSIRLYLATWENPWPDAGIVTIDFASGPTIDGPFLVAITLE